MRIASPRSSPSVGRSAASASRWRCSTALITSTQRPSREPKWWISMRWLVPIAAASSRSERSLTPRCSMCAIGSLEQSLAGVSTGHGGKCTIRYIMPKPVTVSIDVPQARPDVYAFLDVMANHEPFTDHMLVDWTYPPDAPAGRRRLARACPLDRRRPPRAGRDRGRSPRPRPSGSSSATSAPAASASASAPTSWPSCPAAARASPSPTRWEQAPLPDRALAPLARALLRRGNERAMARLAEQLPAKAAGRADGGAGRAA